MKDVVIEFVLVVPQTNSFAAKAVHCGGDREEMLEKLGRDIFVNVVLTRELDRNSHQVQAKHSHPTGAVALFEMRTVVENFVAIEHADVVESKKAALENI